jgi:glycosyltransferase involved in cell wall biosynthesis
VSAPRRIRVVLNALAVQGGGGRTFLLNLLEALAGRADAPDLLVVLSPRQHALAASLPAGVRVVLCRSVPAATWLRFAWEQTFLPVLLRRWGADVLWSAFNTAVLLSPVPVVLVVQSVSAFSPLSIGWGPYMRLRLAALRAFGRLSAGRARTVAFVSETSARVLAGPLGVPPERVRVVPYGWRRPDVRVPLPEGLRLPAKFILTVGDLAEHKNLEVLMEAFQRLSDGSGYDGDLVIAGGAPDVSTAYAARLRDIRDAMPCAARIHFVGAVPSPAMSALYAAAELFVLPSLEETFGLPLVEAMGAGVPVVASDWRLATRGGLGIVNAGPEICGETAEYFDPTDPGSLERAMRRVLSDPVRRSAMAREGPERAAGYSWERAAESFAGILEAAARR